MKGPVLIIGAGLGGLASGLSLARNGIKVKIFERQNVAGGYATVFNRKGYIFDPSLHAVPAGGPGEPFYELIEELGLGGKVSFVKLSQGPRVVLGDNQFDLPNDPDRLYDYLGSAFPAEKSALVYFRRHLQSHAQIYDSALTRGLSVTGALPSFLLKLPAFLSQSYSSTARYLNSFFRDDMLKAVLFQYAVFPGIPMSSFPAVNFIMMFHYLVNKGMYTIAGGGAGLSAAMNEEIISLGGELHTGTKIESIITDGRRASGIRTGDGREFEGSAVVANTSVEELISMLPGNKFHNSYISAFKSLNPSLSVVQLYAGLRASVREFGINSHLQFFFPHSRIDDCIQQQRHSLIPEGISITAPGISDSTCSKTQVRVLSVVGGVSGKAWLSLDERSYKETKARCKEKMLQRLENLFPGICSSIEVTDLATPRTFHRYTGNPMGAIMGFECTCGTHRRLLKVSKIPVEKLYLAGAWTDRLGGFMQSIRAGIDASRKVMSGH